jgi:hypothetical protein
MAHAHEPHPHDTTVVEDRGYGVFVALAAIIAIIVIGLAVLWSAPWDDDDSNDIVPNPDITDDSGDVPAPDVPAPDVPAPDGGGGDGSGDGGEQPAQ